MSRQLLLATSFLSSCPIWSAYCQSRKEQPINPAPRSPTTEWNENWDGRAHETHPHPEIKHQIILIRHGQYLSHLKEREDSQILSDKGFQQVKLTGSRLAGLLDQGIFYPINSICYSTMIRATQTWIEIEKELAKAKLPSPAMIEPCSLIREVVPFPPIPHEEWALREEVFNKDQQRAEAAFLEYFHRPARDKQSNYSTLLVCHGNLIRYLVCRALQLPPETWKRIAVWNASVTVLEISSDGLVSLKFLSDVGHLPPSLVTYG